jgi:hypothetical protein
MERCHPVIKVMTRALALVLMALASASGYTGERLVLITSVDSEIGQLDSQEVRKLFLGLTVTHNGSRVKPLLNESDPQIRNIFLQNVVSMTETVYDRRVLRLAMAGETTLPAIYTDRNSLLNAVAGNRSAVSYAWAHDVEQDKRFKILRTLWHD